MFFHVGYLVKFVSRYVYVFGGKGSGSETHYLSLWMDFFNKNGMLLNLGNN